MRMMKLMHQQKRRRGNLGRSAHKHLLGQLYLILAFWTLNLAFSKYWLNLFLRGLQEPQR